MFLVTIKCNVKNMLILFCQIKMLMKLISTERVSFFEIFAHPRCPQPLLNGPHPCQKPLYLSTSPTFSHISTLTHPSHRPNPCHIALGHIQSPHSKCSTYPHMCVAQVSVVQLYVCVLGVLGMVSMFQSNLSLDILPSKKINSNMLLITITPKNITSILLLSTIQPKKISKLFNVKYHTPQKHIKVIFCNVPYPPPKSNNHKVPHLHKFEIFHCKLPYTPK